jgi:hypothetical protein
MTMYTAWQKTRRLININEVGRREERINEIARRTNAGQTVGNKAESPTTNQHKA